MGDWSAAWVEVAIEQYRALQEPDRTDLDAALSTVLAEPHGQAATYDQASDQWIVDFGDSGFLVYATVESRHRVIVLRVISV